MPAISRLIIVHAVTTLTAADAGADELADWLREHWTIEPLHHIGDATDGADASDVRTGNAPRAMATLRNTAISLPQLFRGITTIAKPPHHNSWHPHRPLQVLGIACRGDERNLRGRHW